MPSAQRGSSNSGKPVSLRYGLFLQNGESAQQCQSTGGDAPAPVLERRSRPTGGLPDPPYVSLRRCNRSSCARSSSVSAHRARGGQIQPGPDRSAQQCRPAHENPERVRPCVAEPSPSGRAREDIRIHPGAGPTGPGGIAPAAALQELLRWNTWSSHFFLKVQPMTHLCAAHHRATSDARSTHPWQGAHRKGDATVSRQAPPVISCFGVPDRTTC